jgi:hypothetical protein
MLIFFCSILLTEDCKDNDITKHQKSTKSLPNTRLHVFGKKTNLSNLSIHIYIIHELNNRNMPDDVDQQAWGRDF